MIRPKYDALWKSVLEEVMKDLLLFVEPDIGKELDLDRGFQYLDKELSEMYPQPTTPSRSRVVDKLVKVYLRDGSERWMLLHLEVQGSNSKEFPRRMWEYFARLFLKHGHSVAAIAILTGKGGKNSPGVFEDRCLWMRARYEYKAISIKDYSDQELQASTNPFAVALLVAREVLLQVKGTDEERDNVLYEHKELVAKLLKQRLAVFGENKMKVMMSFLNNYVVFKTPEINLKFMARTDEIFERKNAMGYFEQLAEIRREEAVQDGLEKAVRSLLTHSDFTPGKIAELLEVPVSLVKKVKKQLGAK
jgi:hypothetical protein